MAEMHMGWVQRVLSDEKRQDILKELKSLQLCQQYLASKSVSLTQLSPIYIYIYTFFFFDKTNLLIYISTRELKHFHSGPPPFYIVT